MPLPVAAIISAIGGLGQAGASYLQGQANADANAASVAAQRAARKHGINVAKKGVKQQKKAQKRGRVKSEQRENILGDLIQLLSGPRSNVYGDTTKYIPGRGFVTDLSGTTKEALSGERNAFTRDMDRSAQASEDYQQIRNKLLTGGLSEAGSQADLTELLALRGGEASDRGKALVGRQALRMDQGAKLPQIIRTANEQSGQTLADTLLAGRMAGTKEYQGREGFRTSELMRQLQNFGQTAAASPKSGLSGDITGRQDAMSTALNQGVKGTADSYGDIATFLSNLWPQASLQSLQGAVSKVPATPEATDYTWLSKLLSAGTNLAGSFAGGAGGAVPKDQSRLI